MRPLARLGLVAAGYVGAFVLAFAVVSIYVAATSGPDRQTYAAMYDFGDSLLFLAVFGIAALPSTGAALFFLRPCLFFWRTLSVGALLAAATALAALFVCVAPQHAGIFGVWSALAPLRVFLAPLLASVFLLSALFAPKRSFKGALAVATAIEATVFVCVALVWFHPLRSQ